MALLSANSLRSRTAAGSGLVIAMLALATGLCGACGEDRSLSIKNKIEAILASDLEAVLEGLPEQSRADSVYSVLTSYKTFSDGRYRAKAEAEFHFLRTVDAVVVRKYRYDAVRGMWERYYNEYRLSVPTAGKRSDAADSAARP